MPARLRLLCASLFANDEIQADARDFHQVAIIQPGWTRDGNTIDNRNFIAGPDVIAIIALIDLRGHLRLEPAAQVDGGHGRFSDGCKFFGGIVFFGDGFSGMTPVGWTLDGAVAESAS